MPKRRSIPIHSLDKVNQLGILIRRFTGINPETDPNLAHRDENYLFMVMEQGRARLVVDFKTITASGKTIFCILPGQVHHGISAHNVRAWVVAVNADLVHKQYQPVLEQQLPQLLPLPVNATAIGRMGQCIKLLQEVHESANSSTFQQQATRSLLDAFIAMFAEGYAAADPGTGNSHPRTVIITRQFKGLLSKNYKTMKSPGAYAAALNISTSYLNEAVKDTTGLPVSYWIQQEVVIEAKRLLYYTDKTVKEIAYELGFDDHAYFSRLFVKAEGITALTFRKQYRE